MSFIYKLGKFYFSARDNAHYQGLHKKDDDLAIENAKTWVQAHPIEEEIRGYNYQKIRKYGVEIIASLKKFYISSSSEELIKSHLIEMSKKHSILKQFLLDHLSSIHADEKTVYNLKDALIFTCSELYL